MTPASKSALAVGIVSIVMLAAVACTREAEEPTSKTTTNAAVLAKASCDMTASAGLCREYETHVGSSLHLEKSLCEGAHGQFRMEPCPQTSQIGACALSEGEVKRYYASAGATPASAKADCGHESAGVFTAM